MPPAKWSALPALLFTAPLIAAPINTTPLAAAPVDTSPPAAAPPPTAPLASAPVTTTKPPSTLTLDALEAAPGDRVDYTLTWLNDGDAALAPTAPAALTLLAGEKQVEVVPECDAPAPAQAVPGGFARARCRFTLPEAFADSVAVRLVNGDGGALLALRPIEPALAEPTLAAAGQAGSGMAASRSVANPDDEVALNILRGFSRYEPVYFAVGNNGRLNAKIQLSFRYRLFKPADYVSTGERLLDDLYLGYTQLALWDLESDSKPFYDTNYRPSLFYRHDTLYENGPLRAGLAAGVEHESNGRAGADSRSLNIAFVQPRVSWMPTERLRLSLHPRFYTYLEKSENPDIADYRGYADLAFSLEHPLLGWRLDTTLRKGTTGHHGSVQTDFSYPLERLSNGKLNGYLQLQYFRGDGETLLTYDRRYEHQLRLGFMLMR